MGGAGTPVRMGVLALLWGSTFLWIELALDGLSPVQIALARSALGALVLALVSRLQRQRLPRDRGTWGHLVVAALLCNALPFVLFGLGQRTVDSGVAGVLNATVPLWSVLLGMLIGTERRMHPVRVAGLLAGFGGVLLIFGPWQQAGAVSWGALAILGAAASYAVAYAYMDRTLLHRQAGPMALAAAQLAAAAGLSALALPAGGLTPVHLSAATLSAVVILGIVCTGATFALNYRLIADIGPTSTAVVGYLLPVVSVALGAIVLHEPLSPRIIAGMVVVLAGVGMARRRPRRPAPTGQPPDARPVRQ